MNKIHLNSVNNSEMPLRVENHPFVKIDFAEF